MNPAKLPLFFAILLSPLSCSAKTISALFVGNSYTYANDMPKMLSAVARSFGDAVDVGMAAPGGYTFENHAADPSTLAAIRSKEWSFVVLQEQSQRPAFSAEQFKTQVIPPALKLDRWIREAGAGRKTVLFETWGHKTGDRLNCASIPETCTYDGMQDRISAAYSRLARETSGLLAPVGAAWRKVRLSNPEIELYAGDGVHPSRQGSYLAACVFYSLFFRKGAVGVDRLGLDAAQANVLQRAAQEAVFRPDLQPQAQAGLQIGPRGEVVGGKPAEVLGPAARVQE